MGGPKHDLTVTDIIMQMRDEKRYPHMSDVMIALRKAKGLSLDEVAEHAGVSRETVRRTERQSKRRQPDLMRCAEWLDLSDRVKEALMGEYVRRAERQPHKLYRVYDERFSLMVKAALDYHDKTIDDLSHFVHLNTYQKSAISRSGVVDERYHFSERDKNNIIRAFREMLQDEHYTEEEMLQDIRGSFIFKHFARLNNPPERHR